MVSNAQNIQNAFRRVSAVLALSFLLIPCLAAQVMGNPAPPGVIQRMAVGPGGEQPDAFVGQPILSKTGRFVMFSTRARNLLPGMPPASVVHTCAQPVYKQWYVFDRQTQALDRISVNNQGQPQAGLAVAADPGCTGFDTTNAFISDDGRYVVYSSAADNLVPEDSDNLMDIFIFDRQQRTVRKINDRLPTRGHTSLGSVSTDFTRASYVCASTPGSPLLCVRNLFTGVTVTYPLTVGSGGLSLARDFTFGFFRTNSAISRNSIFYRINLSDGTTVAITVGPNGELPNNGGGPGREVFRTSADGRTVLFSAGGASNFSEITYPLETFGHGNLYVWEERTGRNRLVTLTDNGVPSFTNDRVEAALSGDGRYVIFNSQDLNISNFSYPSFRFETNRNYIRDLVTNKLYPAALDINGGTGAYAGSCDKLDTSPSEIWLSNSLPTHCPAINFDGSVIAFSSYAGNWVPGDTLLLTNAFIPRNLQDVS